MVSLAMQVSSLDALHSPFQSISDPQAPSTSPGHTRRHSRNPSRASRPPPLPSFSFNPGAGSELKETATTEDDQSKPNEVQAASSFTAQSTMRRASKPPPLPDFKFNPGATIQNDVTPSPTHPILEEMAANRQRVTKSARPAPLPAFTFSADNGSHQSSPSPSKNSFGENNASAKVSGHRRGISEFVGGAEAQLVSTSPQKSDVRPSGPPVTSSAPRGHAHRRSQAVSISEIDTSDLIKTNAISKHRAGSTPTTPIETPPKFLACDSPSNRQSLSYPSRSPSASPRRRDSAPGIRPRVGFSDHIDFIPRPLSMISSETSGSSSTVRGTHSLSGSINSIAASPIPILSSSTPVVSIDNESPPRRPVTADDASLTPTQSDTMWDRNAAINLPKRPLSASNSPAFTLSGSPPLKKKFWFSHSNDNSPSPTPQEENLDPFSTLSSLPLASPTSQTRPKTSPERSASLKKRKAKTWTSGIFSRKSRHRVMNSRGKRTPTPPLLIRRQSDQLNEIFDADDTIVIREPSPEHPQLGIDTGSTQGISCEPVAPYVADNHVTSPVIDLDAALGPFGSEEKLSGENGGRKPVSRMSKLHSSERRGVIDAFGIHRRAESAPQMAPINRNTFGLHHFGSNASLAEDVFDEEEEDQFLAGGQLADQVSRRSSESPEVVPETESAGNNPGTSMGGLGLRMSTPVDESVVIVDSDAEVGVDATRASNSTIEAPNVPETVDLKRPATSPMDFAYPAPPSFYASSNEGRTATNSLISSPEADHISFDHQPRFNRYLSEPCLESCVRASNDDLPSLTDSISTGAIPRVSSSANTRSSVEQRSASVCGPVVTKPGHAWKRASLASLNKLIQGSSNGSRLKFETTPEPEDEKTRKRGNRISRLMHFWRSKEKGEK